MSLINEALKKAQKQRTGEAPPLSSMPAIGGESAVRISKRGKSSGLNALLLRAGAGAAALAVVVIGAVLLLRSKTPDAPAKPAVVATEPPKPAAPVSSTPAPAPATPTVTTSTTTPTFVIPTTPAPATKVATTQPEPAKPVAAAPAPAKPEPEPAAVVAAAPAGPAPKMDGKAVDFIEAIRVAGIRASATDSKVLMNDRVYRAGDTVERQLGLKLVGITSSSLTFEDENGARYTRNF